MSFEKLFVFILFSVGCSQLSSQSVNGQLDYFYQEQLDYLPHFQYGKLQGGGTATPGSEFTQALEAILNSCSDNNYTLNSHFGMFSRMSGISPIGARKDGYFVLQLDESGKAVKVEVYNTMINDQLKQCLTQALNDSKINPGIKNQTPVASGFVFIFK